MNRCIPEPSRPCSRRCCSATGGTTPTPPATPSPSTCTSALNVEDHSRRLKDSGADRFPFVDIDANQAWLAVVCFADALVRWFQLLCLRGPLTVAEPKTPRWGLWHTPARIVRHARRHIVRILDVERVAVDELLGVYRRLALIT